MAHRLGCCVCCKPCSGVETKVPYHLHLSSGFRTNFWKEQKYSDGEKVNRGGDPGSIPATHYLKEKYDLDLGELVSDFPLIIEDSAKWMKTYEASKFWYQMCSGLPLITPLFNLITFRWKCASESLMWRRNKMTSKQAVGNYGVRITSSHIISTVPESLGRDKLFGEYHSITEDQPARFWFSFDDIDEIQARSLKGLSKRSSEGFQYDELKIVLKKKAKDESSSSCCGGFCDVSTQASKEWTVLGKFKEDPADIVEMVEALKKGVNPKFLSKYGGSERMHRDSDEIEPGKASISAEEIQLKEQEEAVQKIQAGARGQAARNQFKKEKSALQIQAGFRGHKTRNKLKRQQKTEQMQEFYELYIRIKEALTKEGPIRQLNVEELYEQAVSEQVPPQSWEDFITLHLRQ